MFVATLAYELDPTTPREAQKLLVAELVGRRYNDRFEGKKMPANCLWIRRTAQPGENVDHLLERSKADLLAAVDAVKKMGFPIRLVRGWVQVTGAGTFGLIEPSDP
ncbi:MAG: hypothetical protein HOW73_34115 [Polyangiaceae bacterium]|nr:hypothetical protein [Polyangiaceae bacterium]